MAYDSSGDSDDNFYWNNDYSDNESKKYRKFDPWLQRLLRETNAYHNETKSYTVSFGVIKQNLIQAMETVDSMFKCLFKRIEYAGSTFAGLKIDAPDEYDLNLILEFPNECLSENLLVSETTVPGHILLKTKNLSSSLLGQTMKRLFGNDGAQDPRIQSIKAQLTNWTSSGGCVSRSKVLRWLQSVVDKALLYLTKEHRNLLGGQITNMWRSVSGPAVTLIVETHDGSRFSMDLVPVFEFPKHSAPPRIQARAKEVDVDWHEYRKWYAVPKGPKNSDDFLWRVSMYSIEKDLMNRLDHFKPVVRIIKKLRDEQNWANLPSYFILTAFLWTIQNPADRPSRYRHSLGELLMRGLKFLEEKMRRACIPCFWYPSMNLVTCVSTGNKFVSECENIAGRLRTVIKQLDMSIDDDSVDPMTFFGTSRWSEVRVNRATIAQNDADSHGWCSIS